MANIKIDSSLNEFDFTLQESISARTLSLLQIQWYQTRYAQLFKEKATSLIPESAELDRSFITKVCELDGKLNMLQELFEDHKQAMKDLSDPNIKQKLEQPTAVMVDTLANRASNLVNQTNQEN